MEQNDLQQLINHSYNMAEYLLTEQNGEFYPFGAKIDNLGTLINVGHYDGDEFPFSQTKIDELKKFFEHEIIEKKIRAYAITFDCLVKNVNYSEKTNAIAIECFFKEKSQRPVYYFPYRRLTKNKLEFGEAWAE